MSSSAGGYRLPPKPVVVALTIATAFFIPRVEHSRRSLIQKNEWSTCKQYLQANHSRFFPPNAYDGELLDCLSLHPYHFNPIFDWDDLHPLTLRKRGLNRLYLFVRQFYGLFHTSFYHNVQDCQGLLAFQSLFCKRFVFCRVFRCRWFQIRAGFHTGRA